MIFKCGHVATIISSIFFFHCRLSDRNKLCWLPMNFKKAWTHKKMLSLLINADAKCVNSIIACSHPILLASRFRISSLSFVFLVLCSSFVLILNRLEELFFPLFVLTNKWTSNGWCIQLLIHRHQLFCCHVTVCFLIRCQSIFANWNWSFRLLTLCDSISFVFSCCCFLVFLWFVVDNLDTLQKMNTTRNQIRPAQSRQNDSEVRCESAELQQIHCN